MTETFEPKMNAASVGNDALIISLCCNKENEAAFMVAWKELVGVNGAVTLCSGYTPDAHAFLCDAEGMEKLNGLWEEWNPSTLLFLLAEPVSSFWGERAEYVFLPPYGYDAILRHVLRLLGIPIHTPSASLIRRQTKACLEALCIPSRLLGHAYLIEGVIRLFAEPHPGRPGLLQELYRHAAKKYNSSPVMVDRAIRHGMEVCWKKATPDKLKSIFGYDSHDLLGMPTNGEFLHALYEHLRLLLYPARGEAAFQEQLYLIAQRHGVEE